MNTIQTIRVIARRLGADAPDAVPAQVMSRDAAIHPRRSWRSALAADATALGPDLVAAWCTLTRRNGSLTAGLATLNAALGTRHALARLGKWRRGDEPVPGPVQRVMRAAVLDALLDTAAEPVAAIMEPPNHQK